jgi:hypothetical protein
MVSHNCIVVQRGETNEQVFYILSMCFVGFLFLVVVHQVCLCMLVVFRCCYICCYMLFHGCAFYCVATRSCLGVATRTHITFFQSSKMSRVELHELAERNTLLAVSVLASRRSWHASMAIRSFAVHHYLSLSNAGFAISFATRRSFFSYFAVKPYMFLLLIWECTYESNCFTP